MPESEHDTPAHDVSEQPTAPEGQSVWEELIELIEVIVLALVAIATAWSGYQAAQWDGPAVAAVRRRLSGPVPGRRGLHRRGQLLQADASVFTAWLQATSACDSTLAALYVRRFTPEYRTAFQARLTTGPLTNPDAPPGPAYMPQSRPGNSGTAQ
jgi:hypothetical protein